MNEAETRAEYIDPKLKASGWGEVEGTKVFILDWKIQTRNFNLIDMVV